jgi:uncharacterized 2Fe-2S/4Fe-4S cluster protein (DUF4445 family)
MTSFTIDFQPLGRRGECRTGDSILECSRRMSMGITNICGGKGKCGACKVKILEGRVSAPTPAEESLFSSRELQEGWRLACQVYPSDHCKIGVPPESMTSPQRTQVEGIEIAVEPDPPVHCFKVNLSAPTLSDPGADADRLITSLDEQHSVKCRKVDTSLLCHLSPDLRLWKWEAQAAVRGDEVIDLAPWPRPQIGLAVDLGTTKIAGYLLDLESGKRLASRGIMNPQISFGEDVITRIDFALRSPEKGREIQKTVVEALNQLARDLCAETGTAVEQILETVVCCNTAMHHLFLGLPVGQLVHAPYVPAVSMALDWKARDLGIDISPGAYVHILPNVAGFVGGDHVAMLLATGAYDRNGIVLAMDIGTNTEVSLIHEGQLTSVSCASGPAFEGYQIKHGMRAARGAIERVRINGDSVQYQTIDDAPPVGICGSGVLDAMAQMFLAGIIDRGGRLVDGHPGVQESGREREFILVSEVEREGRPALVITQKDIRQLQLAKAAIRTGIRVLLEVSGRSDSEIERVIIAGAFGSYIDVESAVTIGMLPRLPLERFHQVGNAAGMGALMALLSSSRRREAQILASRIRYVELAGSPQFSKAFVQACYLGDYEQNSK